MSPATRHGNLIFTTAMTSRRDGVLQFTSMVKAEDSLRATRKPFALPPAMCSPPCATRSPMMVRISFAYFRSGSTSTRKPFGKIKDGAILINANRGAVLYEPVVLTALDSGKLYAVAVDIFAQEPCEKNYPLVCKPHLFYLQMCSTETVHHLMVKCYT